MSTAAAQSQNVKYTYAATHVISDAVKGIEDAHIREMVNSKIPKGQKDVYNALC